MQVLYEDNHIIIVSKAAGEIVQGDKTGDRPLSDMVKAYIKAKYHKPGDVFLGVVHRLDRPVSGVVVFARTSKALARMNRLFAEGAVHKTYLAITANRPKAAEGLLQSWLTRNERLNKSFSSPVEVLPIASATDSSPVGAGFDARPKDPNAKLARLEYKVVASTERYNLLKVRLLTGRHHQIRCQLAAIGCPIKGDLKYGAKRSNPDGSISLHAWRVQFEHPVSHINIDVCAPCPDDNLWRALTADIAQ